MSQNSLVSFLRGLLTGWLDRLDRLDQISVRAQKERWYKREFHLPPFFIGLISFLLIYTVLVLNWDLSLLQSLVMFLFVVIVGLLFTVYLKRDQRELVKSDDAMALLAVVFFITVIFIKLTALFSLKYIWVSNFLAPISLAALLGSLLLNTRLAMVLAFGVALIHGIVSGFSLPIAMVGALGGVTMVASVSRARSAHQVAQSGLIVGLVQMLVVLFLSVILGWPQKATGIAMVSAFASGIIASMVSLGLLPFLESFFSRISNLRLVELAAVNHPLLQRLSMEAPGTYHHSLMVASLAEDAANAIEANGLLCRVGAYFHDIGKMVKSEYFIENQGAFGNPHDQVSPSLSKLVITSHVKEGMALAKDNKLDPQIAAFIPQHHGTSKIEYFYLKALKLEEGEDAENKEEVEEESYRYPGPKPQTKETGIVMLADSVEAISRTLDEPTHQRFKDAVHKIINKKLSDGQLNETPLTLRDLKIIADRFTSTLTSLHHVRVPYPDSPTPDNDKKTFQ